MGLAKLGLIDGLEVVYVFGVLAFGVNYHPTSRVAS